MQPNIREYIINNFKNGNKEALENSIKQSIAKKDEITLPGLGVLFEILWNNSDQQCKDKILNTIISNL